MRQGFSSGHTMTDTSADVATLHRRLLMERSGAERLAMGCAMFDAAKAMVTASLEARGFTRGTEEWRVACRQRLYGDLLTERDDDSCGPF